MSHSKVARVYAESLYGLALEKSKLDSVNTEIQYMRRVIESSVELMRVLGSPIVKPSDKLQMVKHIFEGRMSDELLVFLNLLTAKSRIDKIPEILAAYSEISDEKQGIMRVTVESAVPLNGDQLQLLKEGLEKKFEKHIIFNPVVNKDILGGFIVKVGDTVIDTSMANKLTELKKKFINTSLSFN